MQKVSIKLVLLGHLRNTLDLRKLKNFKSNFFEISEIDHVADLPEPSKDDGYLDVAYAKQEIAELLSDVDGADIVIGIMNYRFHDNFYLHRIGGNKACLSLADIDRILLGHNISLENFILKNAFEIFVFSKIFGTLDTDQVYKFVHQDTRGCLFDMNGDKLDVLHNTEQPVICDACKALINSKTVPNNFVISLSKELRSIRKPYINTIELFIRNYPLFSLLATLIFGIIVNLISNLVWTIFFV